MLTGLVRLRDCRFGHIMRPELHPYPSPKSLRGNLINSVTKVMGQFCGQQTLCSAFPEHRKQKFASDAKDSAFQTARAVCSISNPPPTHPLDIPQQPTPPSSSIIAPVPTIPARCRHPANPALATIPPEARRLEPRAGR